MSGINKRIEYGKNTAHFTVLETSKSDVGVMANPVDILMVDIKNGVSVFKSYRKCRQQDHSNVISILWNDRFGNYNLRKTPKRLQHQKKYLWDATSGKLGLRRLPERMQRLEKSLMFTLIGIYQNLFLARIKAGKILQI